MGGLVFMVHGKMCVGVESGRMMARLDRKDEPAALQRPGCKAMDFTGRPMPGFVFVDSDVLRTERQLAEWLYQRPMKSGLWVGRVVSTSRSAPRLIQRIRPT